MDSVIAQTTQQVSKPPAPPASPAAALLYSPFFMVMVLMTLFYFLVLRPQNTERKKRDSMLSSIQRGDRVLTRGGIYGTVADIKDEILILKISENSKVEVNRSYVEVVQKIA